jgi:cytochrome P450 family 6
MALIFEVLSLLLLSILTAIFVGFYFYFTRNFKFWQKLGIPYATPKPFFGNLKDCVLQKVSMGKHLQHTYEQHSDKPYVGIFSFDKPSLLIRDLELVKNILVKDSQSFIDHMMTVNVELDPVFGRGLFMLKGQMWRQIRTSLTPVFTLGKVKKMFHFVDSCGKELTDYLDKATAEGKQF